MMLWFRGHPPKPRHLGSNGSQTKYFGTILRHSVKSMAWSRCNAAGNVRLLARAPAQDSATWSRGLLRVETTSRSSIADRLAQRTLNYPLHTRLAVDFLMAPSSENGS
jgi:hypothetical protein